MGTVKIKQRLVRDKSFDKISKKHGGKFKKKDDLNRKIIELNEKSFTSEVMFEKKIKQDTVFDNLVLWKNYPFKNTWFIDFFCNDLNIAIEVDGSFHNSDEQKKRDEVKDSAMKRVGIMVFRVKYPRWDGYENLVNHLKIKKSKKPRIQKKAIKQVRKRKNYNRIKYKQEFTEKMILWSLGKGPSPLIKKTVNNT